jgi:hypothetical protein
MLIQDGRWEEVERMSRYDVIAYLSPDERGELTRFATTLQLEMVSPREFRDVVRGRQGFRMLKPDGREHFVVRVERGSVLPGDARDSKEVRQ